MVYSLLYRRPAYVRSDSSTLVTKRPSYDRSVRSGTSSPTPHGIPDALSFDHIVNSGTCPPCTAREFMNYLLYIELAAENLQFYLWLRDYIKRFQNLPSNEKILSPPWTSGKSEQMALVSRTSRARPNTLAVASDIYKDMDFDRIPSTTPDKLLPNPFEDDWSGSKYGEDDTSTLQSSTRQNMIQSTAMAFKGANVKLEPFTVQPFREEITRIIAIYIADESPRQLNLASRERTEVLQALAQTTHPSAFHEVIKTVEWTLRRQAHPNFIRWTICNGNRPRVVFARGLGISMIAAGLIVAIILTMSNATRPWRVMAMFPLVFGIATLFAAWKGMCVVLHGMHHRHLRPWEMFVEPDEVQSAYDLGEASLDSFGGANSYEDKPWVAKYERKNVIRKIFDREIWIHEPALRQIQDTIFLQALLVAFIGSAIIVGLFLAVPPADRF